MTTPGLWRRDIATGALFAIDDRGRTVAAVAVENGVAAIRVRGPDGRQADLLECYETDTAEAAAIEEAERLLVDMGWDIRVLSADHEALAGSVADRGARRGDEQR